MASFSSVVDNPVRRVNSDVIASDATFTAGDPTGLLFAVISSAMFMAWQATVGGRLESRLRFSNTIVWNNLPLPDLGDAARRNVIEAGRSVEEARDRHPQRTLADLYRPETMPADLREAHRILDVAVDNAFGARGTTPTLEERQRVLFQRYEHLTGPLMTTGTGSGRRRS